MLPNFLGLGANRAGSTWVAHNLMRHPDVFLPRRKELHFFDREYAKGLQFYESQFDGWSGEKAVGEVTPMYLYAEDVPQLIKQDLPGVKLFVSLRNPVDRAYSQYWRMVANDYLKRGTTFEQALETRPIILDFGKYHKHLSRYYNIFNSSDVFVMLLDDIDTKPEAVLADLQAYLGIDPDLEGNYTAQPVNSSASLPNLGRSNFLWNMQRILSRFKIYSLRSMVDQYNRSSLPDMREETRVYLKEYYRDEIMMTEDLIGRDLRAWL